MLVAYAVEIDIIHELSGKRLYVFVQFADRLDIPVRLSFCQRAVESVGKEQLCVRFSHLFNKTVRDANHVRK